MSVVETHLSVLFLHPDVVVKVKKPVRLPFADFSTLEARRAACEEEVRCNRRLAPDVYLGVADVRLGDRVLDHAVVMRRLPAERSLESMVRRGDPGVVTGVAAVARLLARFHREADRSDDIDRDGGLEALQRTWDDLMAGLAPFRADLDAGALDEADALARRFLRGRGALFDERIARGNVCDGHGDLQASDVFLLDDGPRVIDAVEFDPRLRHVDVVADVAFLAMDLERLGADDAAAALVRGYEAAAGDRFPPALLHYYVAQRAMVRALVACLGGRPHPVGAGEAASADADRLLHLALDHLRAGRVVLGIVSGLPGTGKSTVAAAAGEVLGWPVLRSDAVRRELEGVAGNGPPLVASHGTGPYRPERTAATYTTLLDRARIALAHGQPVILDATFGDPRWRAEAEALAADSSSGFAVVETVTPVELAAHRADHRRSTGGDLSGAGGAVVRELARAHRPWPAATLVDTASGDLDGAVARVVEVLDPTRDGRRTLPLGAQTAEARTVSDAVTMGARERRAMDSTLYRLATAHLIAPWALQRTRPRGLVLEIGGGTGAMADHLLRTTPDLRMVVTDVDPAMVAVASRRLSGYGSRVAVECADANDLPFDGGRFDFVLSFLMLHHTGDWRRAIAEALRVLRPGGRLVGFDVVAGGLLRHPGRFETLMRVDELEAFLSGLPAIAASVRPGLLRGAVRFTVTKST